MNRSNFRLLPTSTSEAAPGVTAAIGDASEASGTSESELVALFGDLIARGERDEESPDYDLLEAAVDGKLDAVDSELFESRLAGDPVLAREFDELMALRNSLQGRAKTQRPATHRWIRFAAAAVLLAAAGLGLRLDRQPAPTTSASLTEQRPRHLSAITAASATAAASGRQVVFSDSFEGGTTDHWSN